VRRAWSRDDGEIITVFYLQKCLTRSLLVCRSVTEVTSGSDRGILLLALAFPWFLRFISEGAAHLFMKPGIPGHDKAKV
jgi:hypothetical protein